MKHLLSTALLSASAICFAETGNPPVFTPGDIVEVETATSLRPYPSFQAPRLSLLDVGTTLTVLDGTIYYLDSPDFGTVDFYPLMFEDEDVTTGYAPRKGSARSWAWLDFYEIPIPTPMPTPEPTPIPTPTPDPTISILNNINAELQRISASIEAIRKRLDNLPTTGTIRLGK